MITMFSALLLLSSAQAADCSYDRATLIALDQDRFDQDLSGGWRALSAKGCDHAAAEAIREWREAHKAEVSTLFWHEGQMRANAGETDAAIALFRRAYHRSGEDQGGAWALYVDGSIAFLRGDKAGLEAARARLAATPRPADFDEVARDAKGRPILMPDGSEWRIQWPLNLNVLDALRRCWGQTYKQAYACPQAAATKQEG
jgi:hypothetical protein